MTSQNIVVGNNLKLLGIGRGWINTRDNSDPTKPLITVKLDRDLGLNITLTPNSQLLLFKNSKREGVNPNTGEAFQDADYRVSVAVPAEIADAEIARQKAQNASPEQEATATPTATPTPVAA